MFKVKHGYLRYKNTPTLDIYFQEPLRDLIYSGPLTGGPLTMRRRPIRRLGPNSFICNDRAVIIRYATGAELQAIRKLKPARCAYVIDDDLGALEDDVSLPPDYRKRLLSFKNEVLPGILALSDVIVSPNALICQPYCGETGAPVPAGAVPPGAIPAAARACQLLNPAITSRCRDFSHFDDCAALRMVFAGTRSHIADLEFIAPVLEEICERYPQVTLTTFLGGYAPERLQRQENILHRRPMAWRAFRQVLKDERYHIALAPCRDTPFNRARSINKLLDHAAFGAAGLYSDLPPIADAIRHGDEGILIEETPEAWLAAIEDLLQGPQQARQLAMAGAQKASLLGSPEPIARYWKQFLGI